jgi:hypothetical protein
LAADIQSGTPVDTPHWKTIGLKTLDDVRVGSPKVAEFELTSDKLPPPANLEGNDHHCVLAVIHHQDDPFTATGTDPNILSPGDRKVALKNFKVVQFIGDSSTTPPLVIPVRLNNARGDEELLTTLAVDRGGFPGRLRLCLPSLDLAAPIDDLLDGFVVGNAFDDFRHWAERQIQFVRENQESDHPYNSFWSEQQISDIELALDAGLMLVAGDERRGGLRRIKMQPGSHHTIFLVLDRPENVPPNTTFDVQVLQLDAQSEAVIGGLDLRVDVVHAPA